MSFTVLSLAVAGLVVFHRQVRSAASIMQKLIALSLQTGEQFFELPWRTLIAWLGTEKMTPPLLAVLGVASFCMAVWITYADFQIVQKSISFIWPFRVSGVTMAFTIVALQALLGALFHALRGVVARGLLLTITLCLISVQATQSYLRTVEIYSLQRPAITENVRDTERTTSRLTIGNRTEPPSVAEPGAAKNSPGKESPADSTHLFAAWLAAATATLFAGGEVLAFWAALQLGAAALTRCVLAPLLLVVGLPLTACRLLRVCRVDAAVEGVLFLVCDAGAYVEKGVKELARAARPAERQRRWMARAAQVAERLSKSSELERLRATADAERVRRDFRRAEMKREARLESKVNGRVRKALVRCVAVLCNSITLDVTETAKREPARADRLGIQVCPSADAKG